MGRTLCLSVWLLAMGWAGPVQAASPTLSAAQVHRSLIRLDVHLYATLPSGSMVVCKAELVPETGHPLEKQPVLIPAVVVGTAILQGPAAVCRVEIPLCWTGNGLPSGTTLRYEVDAETRPGAPAAVLRRGILTAPAGNSPVSPEASLSLGAIP